MFYKSLIALALSSIFSSQSALAVDYPVWGNIESRNLECPAGTWMHKWVSSGHIVFQCVECETGTYKTTVQTRENASWEQTCIKASKGYYVGTKGASSQTECPVGSATLDVAQQDISRCFCSTGYYSSDARTPCTAASPGYYVQGEKKTSQTACPAGKYNPSTGSKSSSACITTRKDFYSPAGASSETACPDAKITAGAGSKTASDCWPANPGAYYNYNGKGAPGTKAKSPHKCKDGKNWEWAKQACK